MPFLISTALLLRIKAMEVSGTTREFPGSDVKILDTMEKRNTLKHFLDTIKLSKLQNKNKKKKNTRKAQTTSWNFVQRLYFLSPLEIFRELMEIVLGLIKSFHFSV